MREHPKVITTKQPSDRVVVIANYNEYGKKVINVTMGNPQPSIFKRKDMGSTTIEKVNNLSRVQKQVTNVFGNAGLDVETTRRYSLI